MQRAKEGDREGFHERVSEREGKREGDGEWEGKIQRERSTQVGSINGPSNRSWVNAKIGWTFVTFNDLWGHNYFLSNWFINGCARKIKAKIQEFHSFLWDEEELTSLKNNLYEL